MSHQAKSSSVAPPQSSLRSRASAFIPLVTASINKMTTCTTPKNSEKGGGYKPRAAPQCSSSTRRPSSSPTSVVSAHHHTPRNGNGHYNKGGGGGGGFFVEGASPSPIKKKYKTEMCKNVRHEINIHHPCSSHVIICIWLYLSSGPTYSCAIIPKVWQENDISHHTITYHVPTHLHVPSIITFFLITFHRC